MSDNAGTDDRPVLVEQRGRLGVLTLNRPRAINALTHEMVGILDHALRQWAGDDTVETVLLRGAGDRGLCAGGDIVSIHRDAVTGGRGSEDFWRDEYALNSLISGYPKPYVALMDGIVLGGGVGVSAHASHRIVTERTRIGMPETGIGFVPDVGGTWLLSHAPGELGTYVALTAGHVDAGDALALGLADHHVLAADLPRLVELLTDRPVDAALGHVVQPVPQSRLSEIRAWVDASFASDDLSAILDRLAASDDPAAEPAREALARNSPTSLAVTLRALRTARGMSGLDEVLDQEYRIAVRMLRGHDFPEGIRAQVIDKDRNPRWEPATVAGLDPAAIDAYFAPLFQEESA
ncbi:3-hydroxyisobutyryl-CoA hydrolase [Nocardioides sp. Root1257]|uniref:enoyl-CoA hydratase/isomerase family protein n=1 Tax=unclassified Nocardioides TaxID=2615069 RepID=UPI0006FCCF4F|nr:MULTISPECIES: enoyl-CoA hydratase/isomerase family protein [unclassified Nocardioides]KQW45016.1 3-hydroxyisobutyryl-CoA hydrolase [Nocardioides sp. Root1257]KRC45980.1 3-hydroxyisobutyryl-CoA hydrolase [Nocardioides sp. Root224]